MAGIFVDFFLVSVSHETKHERKWRTSEQNLGQNPGQNSGNFRSATFLTQLSDPGSERHRLVLSKGTAHLDPLLSAGFGA